MRKTITVVLLSSSLAWANPPQTFSQGSLVIPMQNNFQTECGAASAYGLVWKILFENRPGGAFSGAPVTVYWAIQGSKSSPNRCVPTNKHRMPLPNAGSIAAGKIGWDTGPWNDGCDFSIENASTQPVVQVSYGAGTSYPATNMYPTGPLFEQDSTGARPRYDTAAATAGKGTRPAALDNTGTCPAVLPVGDAPPCGAARFTKIQYQGGAFIIDSTDAKRVILAMQNPAYPHLNDHRNPNTCTGLAGNGIVQMHMATTSFDAPIYKRITNVPPKIALLDFGGGTGSVLLNYLQQAQLDGDAAGTIGGLKVCGTPGATGGITNCASGTSGLIFDRLRGLDDLLSTGTYPKGYLNSFSGGKPRYKVFWAPHWELDASDLNAGAATNAQRADALGNLAYFADQKGNGVLAECASLEGYEGVVAGVPSYNAATNFMYAGNLTINGLSGTSTNGRNCTDPDYVNGGCTKYPEAADPFSQVGDFSYAPTGGHVKNYRVNGTGGTRRIGMKRLASSWRDYPTGSDDTGDNGWDFITLTQKDNDPEKGTVIYISGHNLSNNAAGTRVVLNTLLNLGADPISSDRSYTQPVGFVDATLSNTPTLVSSVYAAVSGTLLPGAITFNPATGKNWRWPFTAGNLRGRSADVGLNTGVNELNDGLLWNADSQLPLPADRNLFTYFGGVPTANPSLSASRVVKNGVAQVGWVPARLEASGLTTSSASTPNPGCVDVMKFGDYKDRVSGPNTPGLVPGADGICDLQQAMQWSNFSWTVDASGKHSLPPGHLTQYDAEVPTLKQFIQMIRGYCFANDALNNPLLTPTDAQCVAYGSTGDNRAHLGGAVRSTAAIVTPSARVQDSGAARPTVAYVGTWDGQLHAIYVGGGDGYTGPTGGRQYLNPPCVAPGPACPKPVGDPRNAAASTFKTDWSAKFAAGGTSIPTKGTELWSYLPATQLPWLKTNSARVDSSPVVQDAFVDLFGDGVRRWHTILVVSVGGTGRELFAFDVTNPLQPVLLWDIVGSNYQVGSFPAFAPAAMVDYDISGSAKPLLWDNTLADYILPPVTDPGRSFGNPYDYSELGGSRALTIGQLREGLEPTWAVFVSSNASGYGAGAPSAAGRSMSKGMVVHGIDLATGQKLWQWRQPYVVDSAKPDYRLADNTVPAPATAQNGADGASTVLVGDLEGRLWELDAATGLSLTAYRDAACTTTACNFPAFDTQGTAAAPQPITSNIAIAKMPPIATGPLGPFVNESIALFGTAGTDWVPCSTAGVGTPCDISTGVGGKVHSLLLEANRRLPIAGGGPQVLGTTNCLVGPCTDWTTATARAAATTQGVIQEVPPLPLTGSYRVYGNISVGGQVAWVPLVRGQGGDPMSVSKTLVGKTLELNLGGLVSTQAAAEMANFNLANFGGVAVFSLDRGAGNFQTLVIGDEVGKTTKYTGLSGTPAADIRAPKKSLSSNESLPYRLYNTVRRFLSQQ